MVAKTTTKRQQDFQRPKERGEGWKVQRKEAKGMKKKGKNKDYKEEHERSEKESRIQTASDDITAKTFYMKFCS